ncbi:hypothetical protein [Bradyrhizobium elkanii]
MNDELKELLSKPTASIPDVGRICFGIERNASYRAAARGEIETIHIGGLKRVPTVWVKRKLGLTEDAA